MVWILFIALLASLTSSGIWLGVAMGTTGLVMLHFSGGGAEALMATAIWNILNSYSLIAVPIFFFMGEILVYSGLSQQIYSSLAPLFERVPGKLLITTVLVSALFSAVSGSSMATAAAVGAVLYPELVRRKYNRKVVVGSLAGSGTLGILIPPSLALIFYGAWVEVSVGQLFLAGLIPGIMMALFFMIYIAIMCKIRPHITPQSDERPMPLWQAIKNTRNVWPLGILIFSILGTIYLGLATPTEAAGLGTAAALILAALFGNINFKIIGQALFTAARNWGIITLIIMGAITLSQAVSLLGLPRQVILLFERSELPPILILISIYGLYVVMGCFFGGIEMLVMTISFTFPIVTSLGYDPIWFGIVIVIVSEIGQLTPPLGVNLYVLQSVTGGEVSIGEVAIGAIPYWLLLLLGLLMITLFPQICLWLPTHAF